MSVSVAVKPDADGSWLDSAGGIARDRGRASELVRIGPWHLPSIRAVPIKTIPGHGRDTLHVRSIQHARHASGPRRSGSTCPPSRRPTD